MNTNLIELLKKHCAIIEDDGAVVFQQLQHLEVFATKFAELLAEQPIQAEPVGEVADMAADGCSPMHYFKIHVNADKLPIGTKLLSQAPIVNNSDANPFEAVIEKINDLPRFDFMAPSGGGVKRVKQYAGRWIEHRNVHVILDNAREFYEPAQSINHVPDDIVKDGWKSMGEANKDFKLNGFQIEAIKQAGFDVDDGEISFKRLPCHFTVEVTEMITKLIENLNNPTNILDEIHGWKSAFYKIAEALELDAAKPYSPKEMLEKDILPSLLILKSDNANLTDAINNLREWCDENGLDTATYNNSRVDNSELGKSEYEHYVNTHPTIHSNRFALWDELSAEQKSEWSAKAQSINHVPDDIVKDGYVLVGWSKIDDTGYINKPYSTKEMACSFYGDGKVIGIFIKSPIAIEASKD